MCVFLLRVSVSVAAKSAAAAAAAAGVDVPMVVVALVFSLRSRARFVSNLSKEGLFFFFSERSFPALSLVVPVHYLVAPSSRFPLHNHHRLVPAAATPANLLSLRAELAEVELQIDAEEDLFVRKGVAIKYLRRCASTLLFKNIPHLFSSSLGVSATSITLHSHHYRFRCPVTQRVQDHAAGVVVLVRLQVDGWKRSGGELTEL